MPDFRPNDQESSRGGNIHLKQMVIRKVGHHPYQTFVNGSGQRKIRGGRHPLLY